MSNFSHDRELPEPFDEMTGPDGFVPLSSKPQDARAVTTGAGAWTPHPFDAAGWIADNTPDLLPTIHSVSSDIAELVVAIVGAAHKQGCCDQQRLIESRVRCLMSERFGE